MWLKKLKFIDQGICQAFRYRHSRQIVEICFSSQVNGDLDKTIDELEKQQLLTETLKNHILIQIV